MESNIKCDYCDTKEKDIGTAPKGWLLCRIRLGDRNNKPACYTTVTLCPYHKDMLRMIFAYDPQS